MSTQPKPPGGGSEAVLPLSIVAVVVTVVGGAYAATHLAAIATDTARPPANPIDLAFGLINGEVTWSTTATIVAVAIVLAVLLLLVLVLRLRGRSGRVGKGERRVDQAARHMGRGVDIEMATERAALQLAKAKGAPEGYAGLVVGVNVTDRQTLAVNVESTAIDIAGPRVGKTTSRVIPDIVNAPGAVISTSNKRDVVDATRDVRAAKGRVWVLDPQGLVNEEPSWYWDPLSYITDDRLRAYADNNGEAPGQDKAWAKSQALAETLVSNGRIDHADPFFHPTGQAVLAAFLLAAAIDGRSILDVYDWCSDPADRTAAGILEDRYSREATFLRARSNDADDQRSGVFATAQLGVRLFANPGLEPWVARQGNDDNRPVFDPHHFVRSNDTLYLLSKEGPGSAAAVVTALTVATLAAAETYGDTQGGRLRVPLVCILDEVANVCRWTDLPAQYSHFGSRGIMMRAVLQSWSQGVGVWGKEGMESLWSAANVVSYLGGGKDDAFLEKVSRLVGDYDREQVSVTQTRAGRSVTRSFQRARVLEVSDLSALPRGRAVVLGSGFTPMLVKPVAWMRGPHAEAITASIKAHDPEANTTLADQYALLEQAERDETKGIERDPAHD